MSSEQQRKEVTLRNIDHAEERTDNAKWSLTERDEWEGLSPA
jgi:hypothetical protein